MAYEPQPPAIVPGSYRRSVLEYVQQYGGMCRDCADEIGLCPRTKMPCDDRLTTPAFEHAIAAINYGLSNGYLTLTDAGRRALEGQGND